MKDLLTRALDAHGGLSRWREIEAFQHLQKMTSTTRKENKKWKRNYNYPRT